MFVAAADPEDNLARFQVLEAVAGGEDGALVKNCAAAVLAFDQEVGVVWKIFHSGILATQNRDFSFNHVGSCGHCVDGQAEEEDMTFHFVMQEDCERTLVYKAAHTVL